MEGNEGKAFKMLLQDAMGDLDVINYSYEKFMKNIIKNAMLPKKMIPNKEYWEKLGFVFEDVNDDILYKAYLPTDWYLKRTNSLMDVEIIDNNDLKRGHINYNFTAHNKSANMFLESRYDIYSDFVDDKQNMKEVYFGNPDEKLFIAGIVDCSNLDTPEERAQAFHYEERLKKLAREYAMAYYPEWGDLNAYWDDEQKVRRL